MCDPYDDFVGSFFQPVGYMCCNLSLDRLRKLA